MKTIGVIGVGRMGHGIAANLLKASWPLVFLDHAGNQPTGDLEAAGARRVGQVADIAAQCDTIILVVTGAPQVEAVLAGPGGLLEALSPGTVIIDCSTSLPETTKDMAAKVVEAGGLFLDAPMTRTPKEAAEGRLNLIVGGDAAGPILFDVLESLHDRRRQVPVDPVPSDLRTIPVCAYSGHPPTEACPRTVASFARVEHVPTKACPFHVQREIDRDTGLAVRPDCRGDSRTTKRSFVSWPASVRRFVKARHRHLPEPPSWAPGCAPPRRDREPTILNPPADHVALLIPGMAPDRQQIPLEAEAPGDAALSWFVDGTFLGTVAATERIWWTPEPGEHEVVVTDESGRRGKRAFAVRAGR